MRDFEVWIRARITKAQRRRCYRAARAAYAWRVSVGRTEAFANLAGTGIAGPRRQCRATVAFEASIGNPRLRRCYP